MKKKLTPSEIKLLSLLLPKFIKAVRHVRNFPHPTLSIGQLRSESVEAETNAEYELGKKLYDKICSKAWEGN